MRRQFNTTGVCIPEKHYMVDTSGRVEQIINDLIAQGKYFTINRARQYGKSTTLYMLERRLQSNYIVISLSFEAADDLFESRYLLIEGLVRRIGKKLSKLQLDKKILEDWNTPISEKFPFDDFSDKISNLCAVCDREIVLMIDEVDKNSDNQIFLSFLGLLRTKYLDWQMGKDLTFQSVILAGVYDIKNLKLRLHPETEEKYNSPWNVAADFDIDLSFLPSDIAGMLEDYEKDCKTGMDITAMAQAVYEYTSGYPYLVSRLCQIMDEEGRADKWTKQGMLEAVKALLNERNTLFDDIVKKINDVKELRDMLYEILFQGKPIAYVALNYAISIGSMFGLLCEKNGNVVITNRIYETLLYNLFISEESRKSEIYGLAASGKNQFVQNGILNMELVLQKFTEYFTDIYRESSNKFIEENGRRLFLLYLKPIINGTGNYYIESRTRSMGRTDIIVDYLGRQYVIEMKIWHGEEYNRRGEEQLMGYLADYGLDTGYMVSFNFNKSKTVGLKKICCRDKLLIEAVV